MTILSGDKVGELLLGREVALSIGEPWDFESPDGEGALKGKVVGIQDGGANHSEQEVVLEVTPFAVGAGHTIRCLLARARYVDEVGILERLARGGDAEVNFDYSDQVPKGEQDPKTVPFLIGGFHLLRRRGAGLARPIDQTAADEAVDWRKSLDLGERAVGLRVSGRRQGAARPHLASPGRGGRSFEPAGACGA